MIQSAWTDHAMLSWRLARLIQLTVRFARRHPCRTEHAQRSPDCYFFTSRQKQVVSASAFHVKVQFLRANSTHAQLQQSKKAAS